MKNYSYAEAIDFFKNLPHFIPPLGGGKKSDFFSLDAENALLEKLGNPHMDLKYIHVAGTNGKGSTSTYIASILQESNYKVGCFTSPFLFKYNEMYKVNGNDISDQEFADIFSKVKPAYDELSAENIYPSEYEILTVMSFLYFKDKCCDIVVMEVSMGGRVDTTNVIPAPLVSVITPISYDHMTILGNTLTEIATEKAGIIKAGTIVTSAIQESEVESVLKKACADADAELTYIEQPELIKRDLRGQSFRVKNINGEFNTSLLGTYQINNAALAILAATKLRDWGYEIKDDALKAGIEKAQWFGRFSLIKENPPVVVDGGHNRQGAAVLAESLKAYFPDKKITFILGILKDKEVDVMLKELLPLAKEVYTVEVPSPRTMSPEELASKIREYGVPAGVMKENGILNIATKAEVLCIAGSLYLLSSLTVD